MAEKKEASGILISDAEGNIYNIPDDDLAKFLVPKDKVEDVMLEAEAAGFEVMVPPEVEMPPQVMRTGSVINIFVGGAPAEVQPEETEEAQGFAADRLRSTMAKYAGGSTMAKYAGGSTMAKYAGGSTMAKYAGGSTMAKYAGGSTMAKYAGGSTMMATRYGRRRGR